MQQRVKFQYKWANRGRVIDDSANFIGSFMWKEGRYPNAKFSEKGGQNIGTRRAIICASNALSDNVARFLNESASKTKPNFCTFHPPPVKI